MTTDRDGTQPDPPLWGSLAYLVLNLPIGIASFVFVVTMTSVGLSTVVIWVGLVVLAVAAVVWRGAAQLERMRVHAMLGTYVATPYRPLPDGVTKRVGARFKDPATYKDMAYHLLLLPIGVAEFTIMVTTWATSLWLVLMPVYYPWLPGDWHPVTWDGGAFDVDSWFETLPWAAAGLLVLAVTLTLTKVLGRAHARYARAVLGPSQQRIDRLAKLDTAGAIDWNTSAAVGR
ncbi:sensor domain-containing protein [Actinophytocola gossypii]|uniref:Sensor domain-containing protein n=1 Tax=Actinophytocola gossypii TaxID=2812003 RepID=A0ABT2JJY5_9PSEU|nr:sensor domain-containing protein [Actinophytocola gossypii]MCT2588212.1 sensor domain-containing protein [Actinophytocola gossypii]